MEQEPGRGDSSKRSEPRSGAQYRLYFLDGVGRRILQSYEFESDSDEGAVRLAEGWREGRRIELWSGARKVHESEADEPPR